MPGGSYIPDDYLAVKKRLALLYADHPDAAIETEIVSWQDGFVLAKAVVTAGRMAVGHAFGKLGGEKALEKVETAAVGRALVHFGYPATESELAHATELQKKSRAQDLNVSPAGTSSGEQPEVADDARDKGKVVAAPTTSGGTTSGGGKSGEPTSSSSAAPSLSTPPEDVPASEVSEGGLDTARSGTETSERGAKPVCKVWGPRHKVDPDTKLKVLKGWVVCKCGSSAPATEAAKDWLPAETAVSA